MSPSKVIEGVAFGVHGYEEDYLTLVREDGSGEENVGASSLVPEESRVTWSHFEALLDGFGPERSAEILARESEGKQAPRAVRVRITVEHELLTYAETEELLARMKGRR